MRGWGAEDRASYWLQPLDGWGALHGDGIGRRGRGWGTGEATQGWVQLVLPRHTGRCLGVWCRERPLAGDRALLFPPLSWGLGKDPR